MGHIGPNGAAFRLAAVASLTLLLVACGTATHPAATRGTASTHPHRAVASVRSTPATPRAHAALRVRVAGHTTLGLVVRRTAVGAGYRVVLAPTRGLTRSGTYPVIPGRARVVYVVPRRMVPRAFMLSGEIQVTAQGARVTGLAIMGG